MNLQVEHCSIILRCWLNGKKERTQEEFQLKLDEILIEEDGSRRSSIVDGVKENSGNSVGRYFKDYNDGKLYKGVSMP